MHKANTGADLNTVPSRRHYVSSTDTMCLQNTLKKYECRRMQSDAVKRYIALPCIVSTNLVSLCLAFNSKDIN